MRKVINWIVETFYPDLIVWGAKANPFHMIDDAARDDPQGRTPAMLSAMYIASYCNKKGATEFEGKVRGLTSCGDPCGDWVITVKQVAPAPSDGAKGE
jgi:hypothetical protein